MDDNFLIANADRGRQAWPKYVPKDLELRLLDALSYQSCTQADIWEEVKEWLEENLIEPTKMIDGQRSITDTPPRGCTKYSYQT